MTRHAKWFMAVILLAACNAKPESALAPKYFDIKGYFEKEVNRLSNQSVIIEKSVAINGNAEIKKVKIADWKQELNPFIKADINKDSWRGSFRFSSTADEKIYISNDLKIPVKKVVIKEKDNQLQSIKIFLTSKNDLYMSQDTLYYVPDSVYVIKKSQKIKLLDKKNYEIIGKFTN